MAREAWLALVRRPDTRSIHDRRFINKEDAEEFVESVKKTNNVTEYAIVDLDVLLRIFNGDPVAWREMHPPFEAELIKEIAANMGSYGVTTDRVAGDDVARLVNTALTIIEQNEEAALDHKFEADRD